MEESAQKSQLQAFDRLAAFFADLFIVFPLILLITSGIREKLNEFVTLGLYSELLTGKTLVFLAALFVLSLYRSLFQVFCTKTVGQKLLDIEVKPLQKTNKLLFFMRLFMWNFVGLMFPFCFLNLSIFYFEEAESIFDKFFGIEVKTTRTKQRLIVFRNKKMIRNGLEIFLFTNIMMLLVLVTLITFSYQEKDIDLAVLDSSDMTYPLCEEVSEYHSNWRDDELTSSRIETAIALYGIGKITDSCLNLEANFSLRANSSDELGYLAAYLVSQSPQSKTGFLRDLYLQRICDEAPGSTACEFSRDLSEGNKIKDSDFLISKVWGIKRDLVFGRFKSAKKRLKNLPNAFGFDLFMTQMNVKLKALLNEESYSRVDMGIALSAMDNMNQLEFSRWICYEDIKGRCDNTITSACRHFIKRAESNNQLGLEDSYLLGKIKSCNSDFADLSMRGMTKTNKDYAGNQKSLEEVIFAPGVPEFIKLDAIHRLVAITQVKDDVIGLASEWSRQSERDFRWRKLGELLAYKLQIIEEKEMASQVFYNLVKEYGKDEFLADPSSLDRLPASVAGERENKK